MFSGSVLLVTCIGTCNRFMFVFGSVNRHSMMPLFLVLLWGSFYFCLLSLNGEQKLFVSC